MINNPFLDEYNLKKLIKVKDKATGINLLITPRYSDFFINRNYEDFSREILENYLPQNATFVDIGAHYGYFSLVAAKTKKVKKIIAIEPVLENYIILNKNLEINNVKNCKTYNIAASGKDEIKEFNVTEASDSSGFYNHPLTKTKKIINVKAKKIDNITKNQKIDFIKIDTEGHEIEVINGLRCTIINNPNLLLLIEFNPKCQISAGKKPEELLQLLNNIGYDIYLIDDKERQYFRIDKSNISKWEQLMPKQSYRNLFCVPKKLSLYVTIFNHSNELGGAEKSLIELINGLQEYHTIIKVITSVGSGDFRNQLQGRAIAFSEKKYCWWANKDKFISKSDINTSFSEILNLSTELKDNNPHLIFTNTGVIPWGAITAHILKKPHIWHLKEFIEKGLKLKLLFNFEMTAKIINELSNHIIFNSFALRNEFRNYVNSKKTSVEYYNYNLTPSNLKSPFNNTESLKILSIGTISQGKNQIELVKAVKELTKSNHKIELILLGNYNYEDSYYIKLKEEIGSLKNIKINKFVPNPYSYICNSDIYITCSIYEALGRSTVEAMLCGKPVIGAKSGGTEELIINGETGFLYELNNIKQLERKITYFYNEKDKITYMGEKARTYAHKKLVSKNYSQNIYKLMMKIKKEEYKCNNYLSYLLSLMNPNNTDDNNQEIELLKTQLKAITSAKTYKIWQYLKKIQKKIKINDKN